MTTSWGDGREDVLDERARILLGASGDALDRQVDAIVTGGMITWGTAATYASSWLSPSTQRQSAPALNTFDRFSVFVHCTVLPTPLVGTC